MEEKRDGLDISATTSLFFSNLLQAVEFWPSILIIYFQVSLRVHFIIFAQLELCQNTTIGLEQSPPQCPDGMLYYA